MPKPTYPMKCLLYLLFFIPFIGNGQILNLSNIVQPVGSSPILTTSVSSIPSFSATTGTPSSPNIFTISGTNLTASATITSPGIWLELSLDNITYTSSVSISRSGGSLVSQPVTVYARVPTSASVGSFSGNIACTSAGATTKNVAASAVVTSNTPTVTTSLSSLANFTTTSGIASLSKSFTTSGTNLTGNGTVTSPGAWLELSLDNSTWTSPLTVPQSAGSFTGQPVTIFGRVTAGSSAGSYSGNITVASTGATTQNVAATATVSSSGAKDSIKVSVDTTQDQPAGGNWVNMKGDPFLHVITVTGGNNNTITVTSVSTSNYISYSGNSTLPNNGNTGYTAFPSQVVKEIWYSYNGGINNNDQFNSAKPKLIVGGLKPASTYTLVMGGSLTFNFTSNTEYRAIGIATYGPTNVNCLNNTSTVATFTVQSDASGNLKLYFNGASGQEMGELTAFTLVEN